jgi:hypothetical protein
VQIENEKSTKVKMKITMDDVHLALATLLLGGGLLVLANSHSERG